MMRQILTSLIAVLAILLGGVQPGAATAAPVAVPATNAYHGHYQAAVPTDTANERGPPLAHDRSATQDAVDVLSCGAWARPNLTAPGPATTCATPTALAPGAHATTATGRQAQAADENRHAGRGASVAAKTADDWPVLSGIVRDAAKGKGNFGLVSGTASQAERAGKVWVGEGYTIAE